MYTVQHGVTAEGWKWGWPGSQLVLGDYCSHWTAGMLCWWSWRSQI